MPAALSHLKKINKCQLQCKHLPWSCGDYKTRQEGLVGMAEGNDTGVIAAGGSVREKHGGALLLKAKTDPLQGAPSRNRAQSHTPACPSWGGLWRKTSPGNCMNFLRSEPSSSPKSLWVQTRSLKDVFRFEFGFFQAILRLWGGSSTAAHGFMKHKAMPPLHNSGLVARYGLGYLSQDSLPLEISTFSPHKAPSLAFFRWAEFTSGTSYLLPSIVGDKTLCLLLG